MSDMLSPHSKPGRASEDAWRLWISLTEQASRCVALEQRLADMQSSRSWRVTAPLRALVKWFGRKQHVEQASQPEEIRVGDTFVAPSWLQTAIPDDAHRRPRWLVDVTMLAQEDLGAGVQRVTRRLLAELLLCPPSGCQIEPVRISQGRYRHARAFLAEFLGLPALALGADEFVDPRPGDRLLGLDFCRDHAAELSLALQRLRAARVPISLLVHDVLPLSDPQWFPAHIAKNYEAWLRVLSASADQALCDSSTTASALRKALAERGLAEPAGGLAVVPLGADLLPAPDAAVLPVRQRPVVRVLTVGTIEPRKGHTQALDAFELLWRQGTAFEWVIAGRPGWQVEALIERLRRHPENGHRLHWIEGPDDRVLTALYRRCDVLLMASLGEGFGLPVVEAGRMGLGLVLRDIPVLREVAGNAADYFSGDSPAAIADALEGWRKRPRVEPSAVDRWMTWAQSAEVFKSIIVGMPASDGAASVDLDGEVHE